MFSSGFMCTEFTGSSAFTFPSISPRSHRDVAGSKRGPASFRDPPTRETPSATNAAAVLPALPFDLPLCYVWDEPRPDVVYKLHRGNAYISPSSCLPPLIALSPVEIAKSLTLALTKAPPRIPGAHLPIVGHDR
ncbi:hypothetical protein Bbelb_017360 [Branchiostoma belcheri]|nr:hypothetical protein Bbelb_017360 [Branchiostoma belcheri]